MTLSDEAEYNNESNEAMEAQPASNDESEEGSVTQENANDSSPSNEGSLDDEVSFTVKCQMTSSSRTFTLPKNTIISTLKELIREVSRIEAPLSDIAVSNPMMDLNNVRGEFPWTQSSSSLPQELPIRLIYNGRVLHDQLVLSDHNIVNSDTIFATGCSIVFKDETDFRENTVPRSNLNLSQHQQAGTFAPEILSSLLGPRENISSSAVQQSQTNRLDKNQQMKLPGMSYDTVQQILESPMMQSLLDRPEFLRIVIDSNPQLREIRENNPELNHLFNDPQLMRESLEAVRNPNIMREMMRTTDRAMSNIEAMPGGFNALRRMYQSIQEPMWEATMNAGSSGGMGRNDEFIRSDGTGGSSATASTSPAYRLHTHEAPNIQALPNPWASQTSSSSPFQNGVSGIRATSPFVPTNRSNRGLDGGAFDALSRPSAAGAAGSRASEQNEEASTGSSTHSSNDELGLLGVLSNQPSSAASRNISNNTPDRSAVDSHETTDGSFAQQILSSFASKLSNIKRGEDGISTADLGVPLVTTSSGMKEHTQSSDFKDRQAESFTSVSDSDTERRPLNETVAELVELNLKVDQTRHAVNGKAEIAVDAATSDKVVDVDILTADAESCVGSIDESPQGRVMRFRQILHVSQSTARQTATASPSTSTEGALTTEHTASNFQDVSSFANGSPMVVSERHSEQCQPLDGQIGDHEDDLIGGENSALQLETLMNMGFEDRAACIAALRYASGDMNRAIDRLLGDDGI